jgi:hypothetical protein
LNKNDNKKDHCFEYEANLEALVEELDYAVENCGNENRDNWLANSYSM